MLKFDRRVAFFTALLSVVLICGCVNPTPVFDQYSGQSITALRAQQTVNPNAPVDNEKRVPEGMDGRAARETLERYQRSFQQPERQTEGFRVGSGGR